MQKSAIYYSGVQRNVKACMFGNLPIHEGHLPVKYLGVPLISTRLRAEDFGILKDEILQRIQSWSTKLLSYAGRAQLIQSVLLSYLYI